MEYIEIKSKYDLPYLTKHDIEFRGFKYSPIQMSRWVKQGLITKIKKDLYVFSDQKNLLSIEEISSLIVEPSYISLESSLSKVGLIPEMTFTTSCITTKKPISYSTYMGNIQYRHLSSKLFFGYKVVQGKMKPFYVAEPEKALLDFIYLTSSVDSRADISEMRFNGEIFNSLNQQKLDEYLQVFANHRMHHIISQMRKLYAFK